MDAEKKTKENLEYKVKMAYEVLSCVAESMGGSTVGEYEEAIDEALGWLSDASEIAEHLNSES